MIATLAAAGASAATAPPGRATTSAVRVQQRLVGLQSALNGRRNRLLALRDQLNAADLRLSSLETAKAAAEQVLAAQLVGSYEGGEPDIVDVVLDANGMAQLLDQLAFLRRVKRQDAQVTDRVLSARRAVAAEAQSLGRLEARAQRVADSVLSERNQVVRDRPRALAAPFPIPRADAAPPTTWSTGQGVDIAAPTGTPELALCAGTVVLHGIGGLGPATPVLHCNQPLEGHSYVYYGFAGAKRLAAIGADLSLGQRLALVGPGTVGTSSGPHLQIGFAGPSGTPLGRSSAAQMESLLRTAYAS